MRATTFATALLLAGDLWPQESLPTITKIVNTATIPAPANTQMPTANATHLHS